MPATLRYFRLPAIAGLILVLLLALACTREVVREVPTEVIIEKEVVKEVQVPGETVVVEKEVVREVQVPGETVVVEKEVVKEVVKEVPIEVERVVERTKTLIATPSPADQRFFMTTLDPMANRGGTLITSNNGPPGHFDFYVSGSITWHGWMTPMYDNLLRKDTRTPDVTIVPDLAHSWSANDNLDTYTFNLREGVQFHSGAELTSNDVKRTLERVIFPDRFETTGLRSAYQAIFQTAKVSEINTPDDYTVELVMEEPRSVGWVMAGASEQGVKISQASVLDQYDGNLRDADPTEVSGTGPFITVERTDDYVVQEANPNYWNPNAPYIDKIQHIWLPLMTPQITAALAANRVDWSMFVPPGDVPTLLEDPQFKVAIHLRPTYHLIPLNLTRPPFDDVRVRKAVALVFDQEALIEAGSQVQALLFAGGWFGEGQGVYSLSTEQLRKEKYWRSPTPEDIAEAQQLLVEAGYPNGEGIPTLDLLGRADGPWWELVLVLEQAWLKQHLNIDSEIRLAEVSVVGDDVRGLRFDIYPEVNSSMRVPTPEYYIKNAFGQCGGGPCNANIFNYNDPKLDMMIRELELEFDPDRRMTLSKELSDYLTQEMIMVPWDTGEITYHMYNDEVKGYMPHNTEFRGVYITNKWDHVWLDRR